MDSRDKIRAELTVLRDQIAKEDSDSPLKTTLLSKIDELRKDFQEVCEEMNKPNDVILAEKLHERLCHWNHADNCEWFYDKWENHRRGGSRERYLVMARTILSHFTIEQAVKFLELMKR